MFIKNGVILSLGLENRRLQSVWHSQLRSPVSRWRKAKQVGSVARSLSILPRGAVSLDL